MPGGPFYAFITRARGGAWLVPRGQDWYPLLGSGGFVPADRTHSTSGAMIDSSPPNSTRVSRSRFHRLRAALRRDFIGTPHAIVIFLATGGALVVVLAYHALAARQAAREALERTRGHLATVAAWEFARHAGADIVHSARMTLWPLVSGPDAASRPVPLTPDEAVAAALAMRCTCPPPFIARTTFRLNAIDGSLRTAGQALTTSRSSAIRKRLLATLDSQRFERARAGEVMRRPLGTPIGDTRITVLASGDGTDTALGILAWMPVRDSTGRVHSLYGADAEPAALTPVLARTFRQTPLLPEAITRDARTAGAWDSAQAIVTLRLGDKDHGILLFDTNRDADPATVPVTDVGRFVVREETVEEHAGGFVVTAGLDSRVGLRLAGAEVPSVAFFVLLVGLAVALLVAAAAHLRRALALARQRSDFVASVSHELHTPLALISVYTETLLLDRAVAEVERTGFLHIILRETRRLTRIVENLLRVAEADRGTVRVTARPFSLTELLHEVAADMAPFAEACGTTIRVVVPGEVMVAADRDAITQMLVNVLDNALKFGPPGQTIRLELDASSGGSARVVIDDEGPGLPVHLRLRAFERFARLPAGQAGAAQPGHGLGLSVVRDLAAEHDLSVAFEEPPEGVGARFVIVFPRFSGPSPAAGSEGVVRPGRPPLAAVAGGTASEHGDA